MELIDLLYHLNHLLQEKHDAEKVFLPWKYRYNREMAFNPSCKTETMRQTAIDDVSMYPTDIRQLYEKIQQIKTEIEITKNNITIAELKGNTPCK